MEFSFFSCDVIVMVMVIVLLYDVFDVVLMLGVCDKIVLGMVEGALVFGYLFMVFVSAGLMVSGLLNVEKVVVC